MTSAKTRSLTTILIVRNSFGEIGGAELSAADQAVALELLGYQPLLLSGLDKLRRRLPKTIRTYGWLRAEKNHGLIRQIRLLLIMPLTFGQALFYAYKLRPDLINPHSREDQIAFTLTRWLHRRPVVWKNAGDLRYQIRPARSGWLPRLNQKLLEAAVRRADHIYSLNQDDNQYLLDNVKGLDAQKLSAIPSSILFANYDKKADPAIMTKALVVGTATRLHRHKGVSDLIQAFLALPDYDEMELWIIGDGEDRAEFEKQAAGHPEIKFFGNQQNVSPYLAAMDIFVQPAYEEPWGRTIKEAMFFGIALIGSNVGGIARQISDGQTGLLFEAGNIRQLTKQLKRLTDDKELRQKLGKRAAEVAEEQGDFEQVVEEQIAPLYERILQGRSR